MTEPPPEVRDAQAAAEGRAAVLVHTVVALLLLGIFWAAIGYTFWPQLMPALFRSVQTVRTLGAETVTDPYFDVRNASRASDAQVSGLLRSLGASYAAITTFLGIDPPPRISILITDGGGPAIADGVQLNVFYDNGVMNVDTAPFFLVLLADGQGVDLAGSLVMQAGFALYVLQEIDAVRSLLGQPADAWVKLLMAQGALLPLADALAAGIPQREEQLFDFLRAGLEGASFVGWVAESFGLDAARRLRAGESVTSVLGVSLAEAEQAWLDYVRALDVAPRSCTVALPAFLPRTLCTRLESGG